LYTIENNIEAFVDSLFPIEDNTEDLDDNLTLIEALIDNMDTIEGNIKDSYDKINKNFRIENLAFVILFSGFILILAIATFAIFDAYSLAEGTAGFISDVEGIPKNLFIESRLFIFGGLALITVGTIIILFMEIVMKNNKYLFMNIKK
jgi:hypothetical protein